MNRRAGGGLEIAEGLLQTHAPSEMGDALFIAARAAVRAGMSRRVTSLAYREGFVLEQACWTQAAARSGALPRAEAIGLVHRLAPRIMDELDPGRELLVGLPLLMALAHVSAPHALLDLALAWRVPPPLLSEQIFSPWRPVAPQCFTAIAATPPWNAIPGTVIDAVE